MLQEAIQAARPDVAMLQEIYLVDECVQLYTQAFESEYNLFFHRRPGKEDGLLTMVRREVLRAVGPAAAAIAGRGADGGATRARHRAGGTDSSILTRRGPQRRQARAGVRAFEEGGLLGLECSGRGGGRERHYTPDAQRQTHGGRLRSLASEGSVVGRHRICQQRCAARGASGERLAGISVGQRL